MLTIAIRQAALTRVSGAASVLAMSETFDAIIRGGTVIDGTGAPGVRADVAISGDRIAKVGVVEGSAALEIDAAGMAVTPGFIDVHAHDDAAVLSTPMDFKLFQGVTTDVVGNCGAGVAPTMPDGSIVPFVTMVLGECANPTWRSFSEFMLAVEDAKPALNVACMVPHGAVRYATMGMDSRAPTDAELDEMRAKIADGMAAGAVGFSTGLIYPPGTFATTEEIVELAKVAAQHGAIYVSHIRDEGLLLMEAVKEAVRIGDEAGLPAQISHHKAGSSDVWGMTRDTIAFIEERRAAGQDVTFDVYPYIAASTVLSAFARRTERVDPESVLLASVNGMPDWEGKRLTELADELDLPADEVASRVLSQDPGATAIFFMMDEADVARVIAHPQCMIGSDGIPSKGKPHPRLYGTFPRVLQKYVREERLFPLEEAVRKMTSLPAGRFQLTDRGVLREGAFADVVTFDAERVTDIATYHEPRQYPAGIGAVLVNGELVVNGGKQTSQHSGRLLRRSSP